MKQSSDILSTLVEVWASQNGYKVKDLEIKPNKKGA